MSDAEFHGWAQDGTAYVDVADAIADQVTVGTNGLLYPSGPGLPFPAGVTAAGSLYRKKMRVHPDYSYEFIATSPAPGELWLPRRGDHENNDELVERMDNILKHNKK